MRSYELSPEIVEISCPVGDSTPLGIRQHRRGVAFGAHRGRQPRARVYNTFPEKRKRKLSKRVFAKDKQFHRLEAACSSDVLECLCEVLFSQDVCTRLQQNNFTLAYFWDSARSGEAVALVHIKCESSRIIMSAWIFSLPTGPLDEDTVLELCSLNILQFRCSIKPFESLKAECSQTATNFLVWCGSHRLHRTSTFCVTEISRHPHECMFWSCAALLDAC